MNGIFEFIRRFAEIFIWWTVIQPWEGAIRVRLGRWVQTLIPGIHLRIPYIDSIYRQTTRLRFCMMGVQTLSTIDNKTITLSASVGYRISDVWKLYDTLHHAEETIRQLAMSEIARFIQDRKVAECTPGAIETAVSQTLEFAQYGIAFEGVRLIDFAVVKTFRLIQEQRYGIGDILDTNRRDATAMGTLPS
jgi:hypothetical protein